MQLNLPEEPAQEHPDSVNWGVKLQLKLKLEELRLTHLNVKKMCIIFVYFRSNAVGLMATKTGIKICILIVQKLILVV